MRKKIYRYNGYASSIERILNYEEKHRCLRWCFDNGDQKLRPTKDEKERFSCDTVNIPRYRSESNPFTVISRGSLNWNSFKER